jgi:cytochrome c biogenesis protein CcmG, thiol:disulfide interchange protein DsbE
MPSDDPSAATRFSRRALLQGTAAAGLLMGALRGGLAHANALRVGGMAPHATLVQLDGQRISTSDLLGQVVILTFWATWCVPCRQELPLLSDYASRHSAQGLTVLGFSLDSPDKLPQVTQMSHALSFPVGLLSASSAPGYGRMWKIPVSFTIDRAGVLVDDGWKAKPPTWTSERLERVVTPLLRNNKLAQ